MLQSGTQRFRVGRQDVSRAIAGDRLLCNQTPLLQIVKALRQNLLAQCWNQASQLAVSVRTFLQVRQDDCCPLATQEFQRELCRAVSRRRYLPRLFLAAASLVGALKIVLFAGWMAFDEAEFCKAMGDGPLGIHGEAADA